MQSCRKSSLGTITSSFSPFQIPSLYHIPLHPSPVTHSHKSSSLSQQNASISCFAAKESSWSTGKEVCLLLYTHLLSSWFKKSKNSRLVRTGRAKGKYWNKVRNKVFVPKKQELPSLSSFSLHTAHDTKPTFICGTSPANCRLQGELQTECALYVLQFLHHPRTVREIYWLGNCSSKLTIRHCSLPGRTTSANIWFQLTVNMFKAVV